MNATTKLLQGQFKKVLSEPVEGFTVELNDNNFYEWKIYIEGPKDTFYQGGIFQLIMNFPPDYPMSPPTLKFLSEFWHPNVYTDGKVCISILHPPGVDEMSGELPEERWNPTQTVPTILLSVISLLNDPNFSSPANVDASVEWRKSPEFYKRKCALLVEKANKTVPSYIKIPHPDTDQAERQKNIDKMKEQEMGFEDDYYSPSYNEETEGDEGSDEGSDQTSEEPEISQESSVKQPSPKGKEKTEVTVTQNQTPPEEPKATPKERDLASKGKEKDDKSSDKEVTPTIEPKLSSESVHHKPTPQHKEVAHSEKPPEGEIYISKDQDSSPNVSSSTPPRKKKENAGCCILS